MHTELVEKKKWISETRFLHALNFCMLLPGPEATELAIYIGWLLHRTLGGIAAGVLFVMPSAVMLWALSFVYLRFGHVPWINSIFYGLKPAVLAIVVFAAIGIGKRALRNGLMWVVAALAFVALYFFKAPFVAIIVGAAFIGLLGQRIRPSHFSPGAIEEADARSGSVIDDATESPAHAAPSWRRTARVLVVGLALWWVPVLLCGSWLGWDHTLGHEAIFFSKAATVTFGGSYAALQYVSQEAVQHYHWLNAGQMVDGLGLAETTPGPLMIVLQFVGFLGGWQHPGSLPQLLAATLGAAITVWATFVPCYLWIFLGAPHMEQMRGNVKMTAALSSVTAAVVGVVMNLAVWFGLHVLFPENGATHAVSWFAVIVSVVAFVGMLRWKWDIIPVVIGAALLGLVYRMAL